MEKIGDFACCKQQVNAHRGLQLRTMSQIAGEWRELPPDNTAQAMVTIEQQCRDWGIQLANLITSAGAAARPSLNRSTAHLVSQASRSF
ncbi:MAG: hypothetical protein LJE92_07395 [Gammaproteobacteria bacterium]|nr:hypothetical protein [Gammaproteobacteria bacterium]